MSWISDNAIDVADLDDEEDIERGLPKWIEELAGPLFFPNLWRGVTLRDGRRVTVERNNLDDRYAIDLAVKVDGDTYGGIDVERKKANTAYLFKPDTTLPINVPLLTMRAHKTGEYHRWDGEPAYAAKVRSFRRTPDRTFFMAIKHDATQALIVLGREVIDSSRWEWVNAKGDYYNDQIWVSRVPRDLAETCLPGSDTAENFVMDTVGRLLVAA